MVAKVALSEWGGGAHDSSTLAANDSAGMSSLGNRNESVLGLSREEVLMLPGPQRLACVNLLQVMYPRAQKILEKLEYCYTRACSGVTEPPSLLLVGRLGAGKSTIAECFASKHLPHDQEAPSPRNPVSCKQQPVLRVSMPPKPREATVASCLLRSLGDPRYNRGSVAELTFRLVEYLGDCGTRTVMLDEVQELIEKRTLVLLLETSDWLKQLAKEANISLVLIGLQSTSNMILEANEQFSSLFCDPVTLEPFGWKDLPRGEETKPMLTRNIDGTKEEFRLVLAHIESLLPLREASHLADLDMAQRIYVASGGLMRYLMRLLREATVLALLGGKERLTRQLLFEAFAEMVGGQYRSVQNPFSASGPPPEPKPLPQLQRYEIQRNYHGGAWRILPVAPSEPSHTNATTLHDFFVKKR